MCRQRPGRPRVHRKRPGSLDEDQVERQRPDRVDENQVEQVCVGRDQVQPVCLFRDQGELIDQSEVGVAQEERLCVDVDQV